MGTRRVVELYCDGPCSNAWQASFTALHSATRQREEATAAGWRCTTHSDLCPECQCGPLHQKKAA